MEKARGRMCVQELESGQRGRVDERSGPRHDCVFWGKKTEEDVKG